MHRVLLVLLASLVACGGTEPCNDYVDYMCDCHGDTDNADDPDAVDCGDLSNQFSGADPQLQDECIVSLDEQQQKDEDNGWECPA